MSSAYQILINYNNNKKGEFALKHIMKRTREVGLTREQLEAGDYGSEADEADQNGMNKATAAVIGQRKIVKVKRHI